MTWPSARLLSRRGVRVVLGVLWLIDAALQAEPTKFNSDYPLHDLAQAVMGAPSWVNRSVFAGLQPFVGHWPWWNLAAAVLQAAIGVALLSGRLVRPALAASFVWALAVWWLGEAFGTLTTGLALFASGAPGAVLLYAVLGALAWPHHGRGDVDPRGWSLAWVTLWIGMFAVQLLTSNPPGRVLSANLGELSRGQPRLLRDTAEWMERLVAHHAGAIMAIFLVAQLTVGLGAFNRRGRRLWLGVGIALSLFFWVVFQQMGTIFTSSATDPNTAPLVVVLALAAWPRRDAGSTVSPMRRAGIARRRWARSAAPLSMMLCGAAIVGACGSSGAYDAGRSAPSLNAAGWQAHSPPGMPQTVAGVHQAGYLDARAPDGARVGLQFLDDVTAAGKELAAIRARRPAFAGTTVGNVLVGAPLPARI